MQVDGGLGLKLGKILWTNFEVNFSISQNGCSKSYNFKSFKN